MMRLRRLDLNRFGHFTDRSIDLGPSAPGGSDFHIVYGPNEAGKTTLMEAWLRLIYGFPMRDPYGFRHPLNTLQIGGQVEISGVATELVRVKRTANSLLDPHGDPIPETPLQASLGGIGQEDYRKLFCLDDVTIEAGGEEITNSKGDFGRLLFAASAGIGNLTGVLDQVAGRAAEFHRKGASKTRFAAWKRELEKVTSEIKAQDVSASAYHTLRTTHDHSRANEAAAREAKDTLERRKSALLALIAAHPIAADLRAAEEALAPIRHYPMALDIDPEALVGLMTARVKLEAARDQQAKLIHQAEANLAVLVLRPDMIALREDIQMLDDLRGRMMGAEVDLPIREAERTEALTDMAVKLVEMGLDPGADPTGFVIPEHLLRGLEGRLQAWREAELTLANATTEDRKARLALETCANRVTEAEAAVTIGPEVTEVLTRLDAARCVEAYRAAQQRLNLSFGTVALQLRALTRGDANFAGLPTVTITQRQVDDLATETLRADQTVATLHAACAKAAEAFAKAKARLEVLASTTDLVTDDIATSRRTERDRLWSQHLTALEAQTADAFAAAMRRDDSATALRQAQTQAIADHRQARFAVAEAEAEWHAAKDRLAEAVTARAALDGVRADHLARLGLPSSLGTADLADWLRQHSAASAADEDVAAVATATETARRAGEALALSLAALSGMPADTDLDTLFRLSQAQSEARRLQLADLHLARDALARAERDLLARQAAVTQAQTACDAAERLLQADIRAALPPDTALANLREALPSLRGVREINEGARGLTRQIDGMRRDRDAFVARLAPLAKALNAPADQSPLDTHRSALESLTAAETADRTFRDLTQAIAAARQAQDRALGDLTTLDTQVRHLAQAFHADIPTSTLADLRSAVIQGQRAIDLRATIARLAAALMTRLGTETRASADAALDAQPLAEAEAELATLTDATPRVTKAVEEAIVARTTAQAALNRVQGDDDVARLVAQQRLIEVEMQDGALRYLEDTFAHILAERAIRRYRDTHRSGMLQATEKAFGILTNGAYTKLTTRPEGATEVLIATQAADNSTKQAAEMSKSTKFQLYLALRAAAYDQVAAGGTVLPFFCDDIFETFDESRTTAACGLMREIGRRGQAIYLTHHRHVVDIARKLCGDDVKVHDLKG